VLGVVILPYCANCTTFNCIGIVNPEMGGRSLVESVQHRVAKNGWFWYGYVNASASRPGGGGNGGDGQQKRTRQHSIGVAWQIEAHFGMGTLTIKKRHKKQ